MTFDDIIAALSKEMGAEIEVEGGFCAVRTATGHQAPGANHQASGVTILMQNLEGRDEMLTTADLGEMPPERLERLYRMMLEANDLFRDTGGATISINPDTGHVRLQRHDPFDVLAEKGPANVLMDFANVAETWAGIVSDYRDAPQESAAEEPDFVIGQSNFFGFQV